jgi:hypothetical protein
MSCEDGKLKGPEEPRPQVDVDRAVREVERWLGVDLNAPREDQHGTYFGEGRPSSSDPLPSNWRDGGELIMNIIYTKKFDEQGNLIDIEITHERPDGTPLKFDFEE